MHLLLSLNLSSAMISSGNFFSSRIKPLNYCNFITKSLGTGITGMIFIEYILRYDRHVSIINTSNLISNVCIRYLLPLDNSISFYFPFSSRTFLYFQSTKPFNIFIFSISVSLNTFLCSKPYT